MPLLADPTVSDRGWALTQVVRHCVAGPGPAKPKAADTPPNQFLGYSLRTPRWRYTEWDEGREGRELYDHDADPHELTNLSAVPAHEDVVADLSRRLADAVKQSLPPSGTIPEVRTMA